LPRPRDRWYRTSFRAARPFISLTPIEQVTSAALQHPLRDTLLLASAFLLPGLRQAVIDWRGILFMLDFSLALFRHAFLPSSAALSLVLACLD
jgi:hypothetical protein